MSTSSKMWEPKWAKSSILIDGKEVKTNVPTIILKVSPSLIVNALNDLIERPASFECTIALTTVKIFCMKDILGDDQFNLYASAFYRVLASNKNLNKGLNIEDFFHELPMQFLKWQNNAAISGTFTYLTNIPLYPHYKPNGNGRGSNLVCTAPSRYLGFSSMYKTGAKPLEDIESQDLALFIETGDVERDAEQHKKISQRFQDNPQAFVTMRRKAQEKNNSFQFFDIAEIQDFIKNGTISF